MIDYQAIIDELDDNKVKGMLDRLERRFNETLLLQKYAYILLLYRRWRDVYLFFLKTFL